jgi:hypothetical protein
VLESSRRVGVVRTFRCVGTREESDPGDAEGDAEAKAFELERILGEGLVRGAYQPIVRISELSLTIIIISLSLSYPLTASSHYFLLFLPFLSLSLLFFFFLSSFSLFLSVPLKWWSGLDV